MMSVAAYQAFFNGCPEMAFISDRAGAILEYNEALARYVGPDIHPGIPLSALVHPDDRDRLAAAWARMMDGPESIRFECRMVASDVPDRIFSCSACRSAERAEVYGMLSPVSRAVESRQPPPGVRFMAGHGAPFAVIEWDGDFNVAGWNDAAERMFGDSGDDSVRRAIQSIGIFPGAPDEAGERKLRRGIVLQRVREVRASGGRAITCAWLDVPLLDEQQRLSVVFSVVEDVTEEERLAARGREEAEVLHHIERTVPIIVWIADRQGKLSRHSGLGIERVGLKSGDWVGKDVFDLYAADDDGLRAVEQALGGTAAHKSVEAHGMSWENWLVPVTGEQGGVTCAVGVSLDVTELKRAERELSAKIALVEKQAEVIQYLGTPVIEIWDRVLVLPLVGAIDSVRAAGLMSNVLDAIVRTGAQYAILDLTGVDGVDTTTAAHLVNLIRAVRLQGTEGIITGIRATVAQTMIALGLNLSEIITLVNLREGLKLCMRRLRAQAQPGAS